MAAPDHNAHLLHSKPLTAPALLAMRDAGQKIAALTCYDASFATLMNACGVELLLVGDSLGNVVQGQGTTLPVSVADIAYHTASVARGNRTAVLAADMPFGSYATPQAAYANAVQLMQAGAHMVKLEGGSWLCDTVRFLTERGIPVFAHLGLTPQSVHQLGGFKVQGKTAEGAAVLKADALALQRLALRYCCSKPSLPRWAGKCRHCWPFPLSASAPGPIARARSSSCTICSTCFPARRRASCATS